MQLQKRVAGCGVWLSCVACCDMPYIHLFCLHPPCIPVLHLRALQLKAAVAAATKERDELEAMVQQAVVEMQAVQQRVAEGSNQQVG